MRQKLNRLDCRLKQKRPKDRDIQLSRVLNWRNRRKLRRIEDIMRSRRKRRERHKKRQNYRRGQKKRLKGKKRLLIERPRLEKLPWLQQPPLQKNMMLNMLLVFKNKNMKIKLNPRLKSTNTKLTQHLKFRSQNLRNIYQPHHRLQLSKHQQPLFNIHLLRVEIHTAWKRGKLNLRLQVCLHLQ